MKRKLLIGTLVLSSVTWGTVFGKGSSSSTGHSSSKAIAADIANLGKARAVAVANRKANGDTAAQRQAAVLNLVKARAVKAKVKP